MQMRSKTGKLIATLRSGLALMLVLCLFLPLAGCASGRHGGTQNINLQELAERTKALEDQRLEELKLEAEALDRHYGEGRYAKDYSAVSERLNSEYRAMLEKDLESLGDVDIIVRGGLVWFNDVLEEAQAKNLKAEELLKDPPHTVKDGFVEVYGFLDTGYEPGGIDNLWCGKDHVDVSIRIGEERTKFKQSKVQKTVFLYREFDRSQFKRYSEETLRAMTPEVMRIALLEEQGYFVTGVTEMYEMPVIRRLLKEKYQEDFMVLRGGVEYHQYVCAPVANPTLEFSVQGWSNDYIELKKGEPPYSVPSKIRDKYLSVLAQASLTPRLEQMIEKHGLKGKVVAFNALTDAETLAYDTRNIQGELPFLKEPGNLRMCTSFYYIHSPGEEVDYQKLRDLVIEYQAYVPENYDGAKGVSPSTWVFFYEMTEEQRGVFLNLYSRLGLTEGIFRPEMNLADLSTMQATDAQNDAFSYLYAKGKPGEFILSISETAANVKPEAFVEEFKRKGIWN